MNSLYGTSGAPGISDSRSGKPGKQRFFLFISMLVLFLAASAFSSISEARNRDDGTRFYIPKPNQGAWDQIRDLMRAHSWQDALGVLEMVLTPQAVWLTAGTPDETQKNVKKVIKRARIQRAVPVLVAYNIPFRDCAQFSAGGATSVEEYQDWIDGFAAGIGDSEAIVILEPDGLGIIPWYKQFRGLASEAADYEWCQPAEADEATTANERFAMMNYAVNTLKALPGVSVYLDGTHSNWLGSGDAAHRLVQGGVEQADGFFLNASSYELTDRLEKYGTWIAKCIWFANDPGSWGFGNFDWCASQYSPATVNDFSTWGLTDQWYADNVESQTWVPYPGDEGLKGFVIDTSRNGQGPWTPSVSYPDPQTWCNPPGRGLGFKPTSDTGNALVDAYLWIKIPNESDGQCTRGLGAGGTTIDPEWGIIDPPAGAWFPEMGLDLVHNANF